MPVNMQKSTIQKVLASSVVLALALLFMLNAISSYLQECIVMRRWKVEAREILEKRAKQGDIPFIAISTDELKDVEWREGGKEILFHHLLYDVYDTAMRSGKLFCYCLRDDHEKLLLARFMRNHHRRHENDRLKKRIVPVLYCDAYCQERLLQDFQIGQFLGYLELYCSRTLHCESPPPKVFLV